MAESVVILHLSELHFGENGRFSGLDPKDLGKQLGEAVTAELGKREGGAKVSLVVVTGDIAQTAKPGEYETANCLRRRGAPGTHPARRDRRVGLQSPIPLGGRVANGLVAAPELAPDDKTSHDIGI